MHPISSKKTTCQARSEDDVNSFDLIQKLRMAQEINACIRNLLHNDMDNDPASRVLEDLRRVTGSSTIALFQKKMGADDKIQFDWRYHAGGDIAPVKEIISDRPTSETVLKLAEGRPIQLGYQMAGADQNQEPETGQGQSWLILPIKVSGEWWGGLCLGGNDTGLFIDDVLYPVLGTAVDMFGIYFERQIASHENAESDKLVGALKMAGTVCHKLNQPMQVILGYSSMVTSGDISDPEQICEIVKMIENETRRMGIITKNLMGITKYRIVETPEAGLMYDIDSQAAFG